MAMAGELAQLPLRQKFRVDSLAHRVMDLLTLLAIFPALYVFPMEMAAEHAPLLLPLPLHQLVVTNRVPTPPNAP
jgi:hypothetical protein